MDSELLRLLAHGGAVGVLATIVFLFVFGWIVSKRTYDRAAETFRESLDRIVEADRVERQADRENRQELLSFLKELNGRSKK